MSDFRCSVIFSIIVTSTCGIERRGRKKGKVRPRTGEESPEGELSYSYSLSLTLALDRSGWLTPRPGRSTPWKET
jgi:hypothetical protein